MREKLIAKHESAWPEGVTDSPMIKEELKEIKQGWKEEMSEKVNEEMMEKVKKDAKKEKDSAV